MRFKGSSYDPVSYRKKGMSTVVAFAISGSRRWSRKDLGHAKPCCGLLLLAGIMLNVWRMGELMENGRIDQVEAMSVGERWTKVMIYPLFVDSKQDMSGSCLIGKGQPNIKSHDSNHTEMHCLCYEYRYAPV
jgi:hypothetical protein